MDQTSTSLKIAGFGPRLLGEHRYEPGILPLACNLIGERLLVDVQLVNIGLQEPNENLHALLLNSKADYLVLESKPIDESHPVGRQDVSPAPSARFRSNASLSFDCLAGLWARLKVKFRSMIENLMEIDPMTPMLDYLAVMAFVANACKMTGVSAVVLLPLSRDFRHSERSVAAYRKALRDLARVQGILLVDCFDAVEFLPWSLTLRHDHRHLPPVIQQAAGQAIADTIVTDVLTRSRCLEPLISESSRIRTNQLAFQSRGI